MTPVQQLRELLTTEPQKRLLDNIEDQLYYHTHKQAVALGTLRKSISHPLGEVAYTVNGSLKLVQFMEGVERQIEAL